MNYENVYFMPRNLSPMKTSDLTPSTDSRDIVQSLWKAMGLASSGPSVIFFLNIIKITKTIMKQTFRIQIFTIRNILSSAHQIYGDQKLHHLVRQEAVEYMVCSFVTVFKTFNLAGQLRRVPELFYHCDERHKRTARHECQIFCRISSINEQTWYLGRRSGNIRHRQQIQRPNRRPPRHRQQ